MIAMRLAIAFLAAENDLYGRLIAEFGLHVQFSDGSS